ncbi:MAG: proton-conducting transporter membrane subunit [Bryobacterales bacterium]|nr:proton-conducting transporter membrane subunit [Bryobacterales bacterium]
MIPIHVWLPAAHPVAPSNISALMSGIVIKAGIYGMARVFFDFFDVPPLWAGILVLTAGVVSALMGVLYALMPATPRSADRRHPAGTGPPEFRGYVACPRS